MYSDKEQINFFVTWAKDASAKEEWRVAATALEKLTQLRDLAIDWAWLGRVRARAGRPMLARIAFQQALSRDPENQIALKELRLLPHWDSPAPRASYFKKCWRCRGVVDGAKTARCERCGWYKCTCRACYCNMPDELRAKIRRPENH